MGKHPCITSILWGKCRDLFEAKAKKNKAKGCAPPPLPSVEEIHPPLGTSTNTLARRHPAKRCARPPLSKVHGCVRDKGRPLPHLPPDIVADILTRLPAKCIYQLCRQANSKDLLYLLSTMNPYFRRTNLDRGRGQAAPTIVVHSHTKSAGNNIQLYFSDAENAKEATRLDLRPCNAYCKGQFVLYGSYDGFLLLLRKISVKLLCIWNPITKEQVIVTTANQKSATTVCGFYFNPLEQEYQVLCARLLGGKKMWEFQILGLTTKRQRSVGRFSYGPSRIKPTPVIVNGTFYWWVDGLFSRIAHAAVPSLSDSILSFNMEFGTIEAVKPSDNNPLPPERVFQLFELEGELCLFDPSSTADVAFLWVLHCQTKRWVRKHSITSPPFHEYRRIFYSSFTDIVYNKMTGECIVSNPYNRSPPCVYSLRSGTWKPFGMKGFENSLSTTMAMHTPSLVSLDAADSVIQVEWLGTT